MRAIVQLRGEVNQSAAVRDTLGMLNLHRVNHATFVPETDTYGGMVTKVNDWVAHGEPSLETVELLVSRRAEPAEGDADIDDEWVAVHTDYDDVSALAEALVAEETTLREQGIAPTIRLHPPRGGHDGIKHPTKEGGQLGKHTTEEIDELLEAMR
ncbi:MAG: 50S ribosomal protein L30 [Natronomonas sp.]|jgi:large subunit ribosomal protein L30|uniref:Large ribosomal subunit protein uL30 n=1 Tax=Natronomonas salsuginis TaxID=2217661 RepID=A0A4U5JB73_9EURY|nr:MULTISPECIES: 50S ribosomal protein L30 [Natronomonas]MDR9380252.1 50S ribosomal protein L30 [Natronomonas sp.]MDR9430694.1 50S ribosomal protein L30 [Natronomonas sp.]TKR26074.1 50S ribosomal protein L30 [Natronomonas salsuginis]